MKNTVAGEIVFRNELGETDVLASLDSLRELFFDSAHLWEQGSGDCGLTRTADNANVSFVFRPALGVLLIYEDLSNPLQIVFSPAEPENTDSVEFRIGGDPMTVPRAWFVSLDAALTVLSDFYSGARFREGKGWREYLVNP